MLSSQEATMLSNDADAPVPIELDFVAHALLVGLRGHVVGVPDCPLVRRRLTDLCGAHAEELSAAMLLVVRLLALKSRRRLKVHLPHCSAISSDELIWLSAIADAQCENGARRDPDRSWMAMLAGVFDPSLERATADLAAMLAESGRRLPSPKLPTVH
jgi:hypothetical protein